MLLALRSLVFPAIYIFYSKSCADLLRCSTAQPAVAVAGCVCQGTQHPAWPPVLAGLRYPYTLPCACRTQALSCVLLCY